MPDERITELRALLRPAGGGVHLVSTGAAEQKAKQRAYYDVADDAAIIAAHHANLEAISRARLVALSIPSDVGAGFVRGANLAGATLRAALSERHGHDLRRWRDRGYVDIGDVFVVPQLLLDEMLSDGQLIAAREALYANLDASIRARLPASPLSIAERVIDLVWQINPGAKLFVFGGDHSTAWPVANVLARRCEERWAIVQVDAHTDLLESRLGVRICFGTWSYHANELLQRDGRLVQIGIRASGHDRAHWESKLGVRQFWADDCRAEPDATLDAVVAHLRARGVSTVYFSNDIDGTDEAFASATGTPEPGGLAPEFVIALVGRLGASFEVRAADLMEYAPLVAHHRDGLDVTLDTSVSYVRATIEVQLQADAKSKPAG